MPKAKWVEAGMYAPQQIAFKFFFVKTDSDKFTYPSNIVT